MKRNCCCFALVFLSAVLPTIRSTAGVCQPISYYVKSPPSPPGFPGSRDLSFNPHLVDTDGEFYASAVQPDGKVMVIGSFTQIRSFARRNIARFNADGTFDTSFDAEALVSAYSLTSILLQTDGKILLGGWGPTNAGLRLNPDGSLDASFTPTEDIRYFRALQNDGSIIVTTGDGSTRRLNVDGSSDGSFRGPTLEGRLLDPLEGFGLLHAVTVQTDGKLLIAGNFILVDGTPRIGLARLNSNGTLDSSFDPPVLESSSKYALLSVAVQEDEKLLVALIADQPGSFWRSWIVRLQPNGSVDPDFTLSPEVQAFSLSIQIQGDGKVLISGRELKVGGNSIAVARLHPDGSLDESFHSAVSGNSVVRGVSLPDLAGRVILASWDANSGFHLQRLKLDGSLDSDFVPFYAPGQYYAGVRSLAVQPDGKILIAGYFSLQGGIARLNADGSRDPIFDPGAGVTCGGGIIESILLRGDGKILIGGSFSSFSGSTNKYLARLNSNGSLDESFRSPFTEANGDYGGNVQAIVQQADEKILIVGRFTAVGNKSRPGIARLNTDGSLDLNFSPEPILLAPGDVNRVIIQPDQKVLFGGYRLNTNGTLDETFRASRWGTALALQPDGKLLVGGFDFLYRCNSDGTFDATFEAQLGGTLGLCFGGTSISAIAVQANGKILVAGEYGGVARLNSDGSLDRGFDLAAGLIEVRVSWQTSALAIQTDGQVVIAGVFSGAGFLDPEYLARVHGGEWPTILPRSLRRLATGDFQFEATGPPNQAWIIQSTTNLPAPNWTAVATNAMGSESLTFTDPTAVNIPSRYYRAVLGQ